MKGWIEVFLTPMRSKKPKNALNLSSALAMLGGVSALTLGSCGDIGLGANPYLSDAAPAGAVVYTGVFIGAGSDKSVSGTAKIYRRTGAFDTLRLDSLVVTPSDYPITITAHYNNPGDTLYTAQLRSTRGSQNYTTSVTGVVWTSITIHTPNPPYASYGSATF